MDRRFTILALLAAAALAPACRSSDPRASDGRRIFRLGYLPNVTHAPALWGLESGAIGSALGPSVVLEARAFNAGPAVIEALFASDLDAAWVGPNPAINGFQRSHGKALRIVAFSVANGAQLVVQPQIRSAQDLAHRKIASPALGNTQDVALRSWLSREGIQSEVLPLANPETLLLFGRGEIAGAWVPEPWSSRLVVEQKGVVLMEERDLWPARVFPTSVLVASAAALSKRPDLVQKIVEANADAVRALAGKGARDLVERRLARELGKKLPQEVLDRAFAGLVFSTEVLDAELRKAASDAHRLGFLETADVEGILEPRFAGPKAAMGGTR
ncbi:MAG: ABC transporter substrate-binding protein [Deltaproteobacteria bacterium]|nr:MAG: ABC transporter substrate-binding protein [Deltaproteobacteria bacterium]